MGTITATMTAHDLPDSPHFKFWPTQQVSDGSWKKQPIGIEPQYKKSWTSNGHTNHPGWAIVPESTGVMCVDIDVKHGDGYANINEWANYDFVEHWKTKTYVEQTPSKGYHVYFLRRKEGEARDDCGKTVKHVDFLAAPKRHIVCKGTEGYTQISTTHELVVAPSSIENVVVGVGGGRAEAGELAAQKGPRVKEVRDPTTYRKEQLVGALSVFRASHEGIWNDTINTSSYQYGRYGVSLEETAADIARVGLEEFEWQELLPDAYATIRRGHAAGVRDLITLVPRRPSGDTTSTFVNEALLIQAIADEQAKELAYVASFESWYRKGEVNWEPMHKSLVNDFLYQAYIKYIRDNAKDEDTVRRYSATGRANVIVGRLARSTAFAASPDSFDSEEWAFTAANAVLDLRSGEVCGPEVRTTKKGGVDFRPGETACPNWMKFLRFASDGDEEFINWLQVAVGYTLTGDVRADAAFLVIGQGATGKSTFLNVLAELTGTYSSEVNSAVIFKQGRFDGSSNTAEFSKAALVGIRCGTINESEVNAKFNSANLKALVSSGKINARGAGKDPINFRSQVKIWLASNAMPGFWETDTGIIRRLNIIDFNKKVEERDANYFESKLRPELPAILNWAIEGAQKWYASSPRALPACARMVAATQNVVEEHSPLKAFIEECLVTNEPGAFIRTTELMSQYNEWCHANEHTPVEHVKWFGRTFRTACGIPGCRVWDKSSARKVSGFAVRLKP